MSLFTTGPASPDSPTDIFELLSLLEQQARDKLIARGLSVDLADWINTPARGALDRFSVEKRAVDVLLECRNVRTAITQGDAALAAWNTAYLITGVENANFDEWEKPIRGGIKKLENLENARNSRSRKLRVDADTLMQEIDKLHRDNPALSITTIRRRVGDKHGVGEKAIREATDKYDPTR